ncbi:hypothetical protein L6452_15511 [Arctium lappa]|uniref:Uncharacterized protein n=1 Tax=Arctium lappa TaxID=4217 RepID=A0ACB9CNW5_ARCLA|nr:hypothetical protein L6452_15511 [Arctium lappa]
MVNKMGFVAEDGPVQIFVSNHSGDMPNYTTSDGSVNIQKDSEVWLKIIGTRVDAIEIIQILHSQGFEVILVSSGLLLLVDKGFETGN